MGNTPLRYWSLYVLFLPFLLSFVPRAAIAQTGEESAVAQLAHDFMYALSTHDTETLSDFLAPQAMVWVPYDFHLEGSFSHCGIDILTYLKLEGGWKVTSITYDVVREGCAPSPLGEPGLTRAMASVGSTFSRF